MQRKRVLHCCRCTYAMQTVFVCVCVCVCVNLALYVRECVWEHRLQESTQVLNGLNTGKNEEMQFISDDATASIVQVTIPVNCAAFSSLIDRRDVWWFKTICTFWERESVRAWWFTHAVYEMISHRNFSNYFRSYLMKKYELYKIIIIAPGTVRWCCMSCHSSHCRSVFSLRSAFWDQPL